MHTRVQEPIANTRCKTRGIVTSGGVTTGAGRAHCNHVCTSQGHGLHGRGPWDGRATGGPGPVTSSSAAACPSGGLCGPGAGDMEGGFWGLHVGSSQQRTSTGGLHACNVGHIQGPLGTRTGREGCRHGCPGCVGRARPVSPRLASLSGGLGFSPCWEDPAQPTPRQHQASKQKGL